MPKSHYSKSIDRARGIFARMAASSPYLVVLALLLATSNATTWTIVKGVNAIPKGTNPPPVASLAACEAKAEGHAQFTYNLESGPVSVTQLPQQAKREV